ncbi:MAG: hypothetical protein Q8R05_00720 [Candidatus Omnitrophota bacterium]|nr:hypothetical protein [Candidatus Omnitrophota bacterium]
MKRLIAVLVVLSLFVSSAAQAASKEVKGKKTTTAGPTINYTWGSGTNSTSTAKTNVKAVKGQNIKNAGKGSKKPSDYIK